MRVHRRRRRRDDEGFTLAEICVAMALLVLAASGAAHMSGVAMRLTQGARVQTTATVLAGQKIEQLRSLRWTMDAGGGPQSDGTSDVAVEPWRGGGSGLGASPSNALETNVDGWVDYLDARGAWVGTGASPPATARYIRRWSIRPLPEDPGGTLVLEVLVTTVEHGRHARQPGQRSAGDALLTTILTRRVP